MLSFALSTTYATGINVHLNGSRLELDQPPFIDNGSTLVPLRAVFEALGANTHYDSGISKITANKERHDDGVDG
jgi:hypothetical protein